MSTHKQTQANRLNARRSTGPASDEGKATVSSNALKHGFYANHAVLADHEDAAEFAALQQDYFADLQPDGPVELELAARLVLAVWQLRRLQAAEDQALELQLIQAKKFVAREYRNCDQLVLGYAWRDDIRAEAPLLEGFARHRARWERTYYRALHELERHQRARRGHEVPPPEVVEVHSDSPEPDPAPRPDRAPSRPPHRGATPPVTLSTQTPNPQIGFVPQNPASAPAEPPQGRS
jgi:hypothetical protein